MRDTRHRDHSFWHEVARTLAGPVGPPLAGRGEGRGESHAAPAVGVAIATRRGRAGAAALAARTTGSRAIGRRVGGLSGAGA